MGWFYYRAVPVMGFASSAGLVLVRLLLRSWPTVVAGVVGLALFTLFTRKIPDYKARDARFRADRPPPGSSRARHR